MKEKQIRIVTVALMLSNVMSGLDNTIINTALPRIIADLRGIEYTGWLVAIFLLGTAVSTPLWSKLGERKGNKLAYQLAAACFLLGALLQGAANSMPFLLTFRLLAGIGNGGMVSLPYIIYSDLYPNPYKRLKVLGMVSAFFTTATILGPLFGGWIVDVLSWRWVFYINIPVAIISIILVQLFFKEDFSPKPPKKVDLGGAICLSLGVVALLLGTQFLESASLATVSLLFAAALIFIGLLLMVEHRAEDPIIPERLFKNTPLVIDFALFVLIWAAMSAFSVYAPMWSEGLMASTALVGGMTQIPGAFTDMLGSLSVERMRRKWSAYQIMLVMCWILFAGYLMLAVAPQNFPYWGILVAGCLQGFANGVMFNQLQVKVQEDAEKEDVAVATSFSYLIRMLAMAISASLFGVILNQHLAKGVAASGGKITIKMLNHLSDFETRAKLPASLIPQMEKILYSAIHAIFWAGFYLILAALLVAIWAFVQHKRGKLKNGQA